jgi:deoxyribonuclease-4
MNIGLKVYVTNAAYVKQAKKLFDEKVFDYIEVFLVAGKSLSCIADWIATGIPLAFHAAHSYEGFNPSLVSKYETNLQIAAELADVCLLYKPEYIVFHPGISGELSETIRQFNKIFDMFSILHNGAVIENKPILGMRGEICIGATPDCIKKISSSLNIGCCLDFGHAMCAAATKMVPWRMFIEEFLLLNPSVFHISDGHAISETDEHLHIGSGNYSIDWFLSKVKKGSFVAIETIKDSQCTIDDFVTDANNVRECYNNVGRR